MSQVKIFTIRCALFLYWIANNFGYRVTKGTGVLTRALTKNFIFSAHGAKWYFDPKIGTGYGLILGWGWNEPETWKFINALLDAGQDSPTIIDVGAHLGEYAIPLALKFPGGEVHAYEPIPSFAECLFQSTQKSNIKNINIHRVGLGASSSINMFAYDPKAPTGASIADENHKNESLEKFNIEVRTLDQDYLENQKLKLKPALMIIDVEGYEADVLRGGVVYIRENNPVIIFEYNATSRKRFSIDDIRSIVGEKYKIFKIDKSGELSRNLNDTWNCVAFPINGPWAAVGKNMRINN